MRSKAVVKKTRPRTFKISRRMGAAKSFLHKFRTFCFWTAKQRVKQVDFRKSAKERQDHRLNRQVIATRCERVAPRFQIMCKRNMPVTER